MDRSSDIVINTIEVDETTVKIETSQSKSQLGDDELPESNIVESTNEELPHEKVEELSHEKRERTIPFVVAFAPHVIVVILNIWDKISKS